MSGETFQFRDIAPGPAMVDVDARNAGEPMLVEVTLGSVLAVKCPSNVATLPSRPENVNTIRADSVRVIPSEKCLSLLLGPQPLLRITCH